MEKKETTIEDLAQMVANGFSEVHEVINERFDQVDKKFEENKQEHQKIQKRLSVIEFEITELAHRAELDQLKARVTKLEQKLGIV